jgi:hypothetical protein
LPLFTHISLERHSAVLQRCIVANGPALREK